MMIWDAIWLILVAAVAIYVVIKVKKENLSIVKFISLIVLPPLLVGICAFIFDTVYSNESINSKLSDFIFICFLSFMLMLPALLFYAVYILSLEKNFSPPAWKLFIWTMIIAIVSAMPYTILLQEPLFVLVPMITGPMSMAVVYYFSKWRAR